MNKSVHFREEIVSHARRSLHLLKTFQNDQTPKIGLHDDVSSSGATSNPCLRMCIDQGVLSLEMLLEVMDYVELLEGQKQKLRYKLRRVLEETSWLRGELNVVQHRHISSETRVAELEVQLEQKRFMEELSQHQPPAEKQENSDKNDKEKNRGVNKQEWNDVMVGSQINTMGTHSAIVGSYEVPSRLRTLHNLVIQYACQGRYEVAVPLCKQALEDLEKTSGHEHPDVATMLNILALVYRDQGKFRESAALLNDALAIREKTLGPEHPAVAATLNNLAVLYGKRAKYKEAEPLCKRALHIREKVLGENHPDVAKQLNNLALLCQNQNKYDEVEACYRRALHIYSLAYGPDNPNVAKTKVSLACAFLKQGKYREAEEIYKEVLTRAHELERGQITSTNKPIWMLAEDLQEQVSATTTPHSSFPLSSADLAGLRSVIPGTSALDHSTMVTTLKNLASLYRRQGKYQAAQTIEELVQQHGEFVSNHSYQSMTPMTISAYQFHQPTHFVSSSNNRLNTSPLNFPTSSASHANIGHYQSFPQLNQAFPVTTPGPGDHNTTDGSLLDDFAPRSGYFNQQQHIRPRKDGTDTNVEPTKHDNRNSLQQITEKFTARFCASSGQSPLRLGNATNINMAETSLSTTPDHKLLSDQNNEDIHSKMKKSSSMGMLSGRLSGPQKLVQAAVPSEVGELNEVQKIDSRRNRNFSMIQPPTIKSSTAEMDSK